MSKIKNLLTNSLINGLTNTSMGKLIMVGSFGLVVYLTIKDGSTAVVESLITTSIIVAATLMGVTSVADIFKVNRTSEISSTVISSTNKNESITIANEKDTSERPVGNPPEPEAPVDACEEKKEP